MQQSEGQHLTRAAARQQERSIVQASAGQKRAAVGRTGMPFIKPGDVLVEKKGERNVVLRN